MAKRKSRKKPSRKKLVYKLDRKFNCPKWNHQNVVSCHINRSKSTGKAYCNVCEAYYNCPITKLDQQIDVYNYWLDSL